MNHKMNNVITRAALHKQVALGYVPQLNGITPLVKGIQYKISPALRALAREQGVTCPEMVTCDSTAIPRRVVWHDGIKPPYVESETDPTFICGTRYNYNGRKFSLTTEQIAQHGKIERIPSVGATIPPKRKTLTVDISKI